MEIISKYNLLNKFGSAYTWETLDNISYLDFAYICKCMEYEAKAIEFSTKSKGKNEVIVHG